MRIEPYLESAVEELLSVADSSRVSQLSLVPRRRAVGLTAALSRGIPGREDEDEWNADAGRVEDEEWKVDVTPPRRGGLAGEMLRSESGFDSMRVLGGRGAEDEDIEGVEEEEAKLPGSEESTCVTVGRV